MLSVSENVFFVCLFVWILGGREQVGTPKQMPGFLKANFSPSTGPPGKETDWVLSAKGSLQEFVQVHHGTSCGDALSTDSILLSER